MSKKYFNYFYLFTIFVFIFLTAKYYFSEKNIILKNKSRSAYSVFFENRVNDLKILTNDTNDIIVYINGLEDFKNKKKKRIWESLINNTNE